MYVLVNCDIVFPDEVDRADAAKPLEKPVEQPKTNVGKASRFPNNEACTYKGAPGNVGYSNNISNEDMHQMKYRIPG